MKKKLFHKIKLFLGIGIQIFIISVSFQNCDSNNKLTTNTPTPSPTPPSTPTPTPSPVDDSSDPLCSTVDLESAMTSTLNSVSVKNEFSFLVERPDGRQFSYNRGSSSLNDLYQSASTSKLVSAVIILRAVDKGYLTLDSKPQDYIKNGSTVIWSIASTKPLYNYITLRKLLSFTSGFTSTDTDVLCLSNATSDFQACANNVGYVNRDKPLPTTPQFYYSSAHLQVAGLMAIKASGASSWQDLFTQFKNETGLFASSTYDLPSATNPRLAGGMHWKATEYFAFLKAFKNGALLSPSLMNEMISDQTPTADLAYSPLIVALNEAWHYGFGSWQECQSSTYNCTPGTRISSPGAYGSYPYWDRSKNYIGLVANQATATGNFPEGISIERSVRSQVESWIDCH